MTLRRAESKKWAPKCRSAYNMAKAAVSTGKAMMMRKLVTSMFHAKMGTRNITIPGALRQKTVVMRLTAVKMPENPVKATPMIHRSAPGPGEWMASVNGA